MKYIEVKALIKKELTHSKDGYSWNELNSRLNLPYKTLCPEWTKQLEEDIGLQRKKVQGQRSYIWCLEN